MVFCPGRFQIRPGTAEHLSSQRLCMVVCHPESHVEGKVLVAQAVAVCARDDNVAAQTQQSFKGHLPGKVFIPIRFLRHKQHFIVDEPASVVDCKGCAPGTVFLKDSVRFSLKALMSPEPEWLHSQCLLTEVDKSIDKAKLI